MPDSYNFDWLWDDWIRFRDQRIVDTAFRAMMPEPRPSPMSRTGQWWVNGVLVDEVSFIDLDALPEYQGER